MVLPKEFLILSSTLLTHPSIDEEVEDLVAALARRSSRTAKTTTPHSIKKRKLQKGAELLAVKQEGAALSAVAATTTGASGSITPESVKSKQFTPSTITTVAVDPEDPTTKHPKTQEGSKTVSYEVSDDQFRPQMLLPNRCYVSKNDSLMEVPKLRFQLSKGITLHKDMASVQLLDDASLVRTGVVSTLRVSLFVLRHSLFLAF